MADSSHMSTSNADTTRSVGGIAEPIRRYRETYRSTEIPAGYRPILHLGFTFGAGSLALLWCIAALDTVQAVEWLTVPLAFLYANLVEYIGHRYPMHRPYPGLKVIYRRHAGQHHRFFTHESMPLDGLRDLRAVLFPPSLVVFFFGGFAGPIWFLLAWTVSANVAWLFLATGLAYYLSYELLHLAYHAPDESRLGRARILARLRALHQAHHDPELMSRCNFNITWPLGDWLFGTFAREATERLRDRAGEHATDR